MKKLTKSQKIILLSLTLFTLTILVAVFHEEGLLTINEFDQSLQKLKEDNERLKKENSKISEEVKALKSDPAAIEKVAREKLNLVKPGEIVYQIVKKSEKEPTPPPKSSPNDSLF